MYYFDSITESDNYKIYSNISHNFNLFIGVAAESMSNRLKETFIIRDNTKDSTYDNTSVYEKSSIFVFNDKKSIDDFIETVDQNSIESLMDKGLTKEFNPAPNGVYGFNTQMRKFSELEDIVFFVPNITLSPYEEIYNYAPFFQAITEQFLNKYLTLDMPDWLLRGILISVEDYKKEFEFSLKYRLENYKCATYERTFWTKLVSLNRYWNNDKFTLNQILEDRVAINKSDPVYESYVSLLVHYLFFNPADSNKSRNLTKRMYQHIQDNNSIDTETLKMFIMEEFNNDLNQLEQNIRDYYSPNSSCLKIKYFWSNYNNGYKSNKDSHSIIYTTKESSYPDDNVINPLRNVNDGDMENFYESTNFFHKGESIIIDTKANLMVRKILVNFGDFGVGNSFSNFNNNLSKKARIISSVNGKSWRNWGYINTDMPVVYFSEFDYIPARYWGIVIDEDMERPITINEMYIK